MGNELNRYLGFDCGNSSIRTVLGTFDGSRISLEVVNKIPNREYRGIQYHYWDILAIFHEIVSSMKRSCDQYPEIRSFGISTWGIDFGLLGTSGELLGNPLCYRNPLGSEGMKSLTQGELEKLFAATGIQNLPMNSMYQLLGIRKSLPEYYAGAKTLLLIPDLLNHMLTDELNSEVSIASTTQLLDMRTRTYSNAVFSQVDLNRELFMPMVPHTEVRGHISERIAQLNQIPRIPAMSVPAHDTAAAVVSVPTEANRFAFISSGTWSLIGTEIPEPIITKDVEDAGFSNEGGVFGTITLLKNSCGMHILQLIKRELEFTEHRAYTWDEIIAHSIPALKRADLPEFDVNAEELYLPDSMIGAIRKLTGLQDTGAIIASAYKSLAASYQVALEDLERITGDSFDTIHIIGGGARNDHLNQMTADRTGKRVVAGPEEATSLGTIAVQIMHDHPELKLADIRRIIRNSIQCKTFSPSVSR